MENDAVRNRRVSSFPHRINSSARPRSSCPKHSAMNHDGPAFSSSSFRHAVLGAGRPCSSCGPNVMCTELGTCLPLSGSGFPELADGDGCVLAVWSRCSHSIAVSLYRANSDVVCRLATLPVWTLEPCTDHATCTLLQLHIYFFSFFERTT